MNRLAAVNTNQSDWMAGNGLQQKKHFYLGADY